MLLIRNLVVCVVAAKMILRIPFSTAGVVFTVTFLFVCVERVNFTMTSSNKNKKSKSRKLGLTLSVARVDKRMRDMRLAKHRVGATASVYATAVVEEIVRDVVRAANKLAVAQTSKQLLARHIQVAVLQNDMLNAVLSHISIGTREDIPDPVHWILTKDQQKKRINKQEELAKKKESLLVSAKNA